MHDICVADGVCLDCDLSTQRQFTIGYGMPLNKIYHFHFDTYAADMSCLNMLCESTFWGMKNNIRIDCWSSVRMFQYMLNIRCCAGEADHTSHRPAFWGIQSRQKLMGADVLNTLQSNSSITQGDCIRIIHTRIYIQVFIYAITSNV